MGRPHAEAGAATGVSAQPMANPRPLTGENRSRIAVEVPQNWAATLRGPQNPRSTAK